MPAGQEAGARPRVIVSVTATADGRVTLSRAERLLERTSCLFAAAGTAREDLGCALAKIRTQLGAECLVSQAGGGLNGALLRAGLVDRGR